MIINQSRSCPKCGAPENIGPECNSCGVIYAKASNGNFASIKNTLTEGQIKDHQKDSTKTGKTRERLGFGIFALIFVGGIFAMVDNQQIHSSYQTKVSSTTQLSQKSGRMPLIVSNDEYGERWPYTIPNGQILCRERYAGDFLKKDVTITHDGNTYALNGSARGNSEYLPLERIWRDNPKSPGSKIDEKEIIQRGLDLCR